MKKSVLTFIAIAVSSLAAIAQDKISINGFKLQLGTTKTVALELTNDKAYTAFQMDVELPEGVVLGGEDAVSLCDDRAHSSHVVDYEEVETNVYRIIAYSTEKAEFRGNSGALLNLVLRANTTAEIGVYELVASDIVFTDTDAKDYALEDAKAEVKVIPAYRITAVSADEKRGTVTLIGGGEAVEDGTEVTATATAALGHTFENWTVNGRVVSTENPYTFKAEKDVELVANFSVNVYKVHYVLEYKVMDVPYGEAIPEVEEPEKEGHTFNGWVGLPDTMPAEDVYVTGTFTIIDAIAMVNDMNKGKIVGVYSLDGKKVNDILPNQVYVVVYNDGRRVKSIVRNR